jgi:hypothetical protein
MARGLSYGSECAHFPAVSHRGPPLVWTRGGGFLTDRQQESGWSVRSWDGALESMSWDCCRRSSRGVTGHRVEFFACGLYTTLRVIPSNEERFIAQKPRDAEEYLDCEGRRVRVTSAEEKVGLLRSE